MAKNDNEKRGSDDRRVAPGAGMYQVNDDRIARDAKNCFSGQPKVAAGHFIDKTVKKHADIWRELAKH